MLCTNIPFCGISGHSLIVFVPINDAQKMQRASEKRCSGLFRHHQLCGRTAQQRQSPGVLQQQARTRHDWWVSGEFRVCMQGWWLCGEWARALFSICRSTPWLSWSVAAHSAFLDHFSFLDLSLHTLLFLITLLFLVCRCTLCFFRSLFFS